MSDTFYSVAAVGQTMEMTTHNIVVAATTQTSSIELRITDGALNIAQARQFCERLANIFETRDQQVIPTGTILT